MAVFDHFWPFVLAIYITSFTKLWCKRSFWGAKHKQVSILIGSQVMIQNKNIFIFVSVRFCKKKLNTWSVDFCVFLLLHNGFQIDFNLSCAPLGKNLRLKVSKFQRHIFVFICSKKNNEIVFLFLPQPLKRVK